MAAPPPNPRTGGCLCGKVRCTITDGHGPDMTAIFCNCVNCQHNFGRSFAGSFIPIGNYKLAEGSREHLKIYADRETTSKDTMQRQFCSNCGSCVLITTDHNTSVAIVPVGSMDCGGKGWWKPEHECFASNKQDWKPAYDGLKVWDGMPVFG